METSLIQMKEELLMSHFNIQNDDTTLLHGGQVPDPTTGSRAVPIYQTTSYVFKDTEHAQNLFGLKEPGNIYTRIMNPTVDAFEQRVALLEDGVAAVATSSGMAAITLAILNIAGAGDEIVTDSNLYGGTYNLFVHTLPKYGIDVKFVDGTNPEAFEEVITSRTKAIFGETITNPSLNVFDIEAVAKIAHKHHIPLIIDNTFAPYIAKPIQWGADIVVHSATKWIGGHGTTIGGIVVDGGRFDWNHERFPGFTEPDKSYAGLRYVDIGPAAYATKFRVQLLRDIGASLSPQNAFLLLQGLETLHLRIEHHNRHAEKVAAYLLDHPAVEWVNFPGLDDHPSHDLAKKYFKDGYGAVITFGIKGGRESGRKLIDNVSLWSHVANVGDAKSLIIHPASTTHQQLNAEDLKKSGTTEELVRLAVGLEDIQDLLEDLDQAIAQAVDEPRHLTSTDDIVIKWLLSSPFDRNGGELRKKTIVFISKQVTEHVQTKINYLTELGFQVISIDDTSEVNNLSSGIDAVWATEELLTEEILKQSRIVWIEDQASDHLLKQAKDYQCKVISQKDIVHEAKQLRGK